MTEKGISSDTQKDESQDNSAAFTDFNLLPEIEAAISKMGFKTPTPVQARTFETAMSGRDLIAMAQTGTGKTAAFGIPLAQKLDPEKEAVQALVLVPTRELALQVCKELMRIGKERGVKSAAVYGGASFTKQVSEVKDGARVVVGTPGRVLDHIRRKTIRFKSLATLVLDEADEMLSMGFEKEISEIIESLPKERQTFLFSATIPEDIRRLSKRYMGEPVVISVSGDDVAAKDVTHFVYLVSGQSRQQTMVKVIEVEQPDSALIFCNTREETQSLAQFLKKAGYNADWINSDLTQHERERVMQNTRNGNLRFLVATDVAARGIDVSHLSHVINFSFPESCEIYVHRTGRTGRAGRQGVAISLISPQDLGNLYMLRLTYKIYPVEKTLLGDEDTARAVELEQIEKLRKSFKAYQSTAYLGLAKRLVQDLRADSIIAGLLESFFNTGGDVPMKAVSTQKTQKNVFTKDRGRADKTSKRETRESKGPKASASSPSKSPKSGVPRDSRGPKASASRPSKSPKSGVPRESKAPKPSTSRTSKPPKESAKDPDKTPIQGKEDSQEKRTELVTNPPGGFPKNEAEGSDETINEIYVDAGRKDGLRISDLMKVVMQKTGLPRTALGKVRMLARSTFLSVPFEYFDTVLKALSSTEIDGTKLKAEPADQK